MTDKLQMANEACARSLFASLHQNAKDLDSSCVLQEVGSLKLKDGRETHLSILYASDLSPQERDAVVALFEANMKDLYLASKDGYDSKEKREELFHAESRFLLVREKSQDVAEAQGDIVAFSMFRFDMEDTASDDEIQVEVLYCYEVQVSSKYQGTGLGRFLMRALEVLARTYSMQKVVLTVFTLNTAARHFYKCLGYENDEICPSQYEVEEGEEMADYEILSKVIRARSTRNKNKKKKKPKNKQDSSLGSSPGKGNVEAILSA